MRPIVRNPYIAGKAIRDTRLFVGRDDVIELVARALDAPEQNAVVLFGQRRIGKTSILLQLQSRLPSTRFHPVYFDLMDRAGKSLRAITSELAAATRASLGLDDSMCGGAVPDELLETLPRAYESLSEDVRLTFLFDEFDVLDVAAEEELPPDAAARTFFPYLRQLMNDHPRLAFIFVVGRKAGDLSIDVKATFKGARHHRISVLNAAEATRLIEIGDREGTLRFTAEAKARILALTRGHPYFTQLCCQVLFDSAYAANPDHGAPITSDAVDSAVPAVVEAGENVFEWIWDGLPPAERVVFAAVAAGTKEGVVISEDDLTQVLQRHGIRILIRELELAPATLIEWEMLIRADGGYKFFVELMRSWVADRKPLPLVKNEIDRINPLADQYYQLGCTFYRSNEFNEAVTHLQAAIKVNPNHLKARLLLAEALTLLNRTAEAVDHYREAYRYDEDATRYHLVRGLLTLADESHAARDDGRAIELYDEVLDVSPLEIVAKERRHDLLITRGDACLIAGDLQGAIKAFQQAGAADRVRAVESSYRQKRVEALSSDLTRAMKEERWLDADRLCHELMTLRPDEPRWNTMLAEIVESAYLSKLYSEGLGLLQQQKWREAQQAFVSVVAKSPEYKDAAERLAVLVARRRRESKSGTAGLEHARAVTDLAPTLFSDRPWTLVRNATNHIFGFRRSATSNPQAFAETLAETAVGFYGEMVERPSRRLTLSRWAAAFSVAAATAVCAYGLVVGVRSLLQKPTKPPVPSTTLVNIGVGSRWIYSNHVDGLRIWRIGDGTLVRTFDREFTSSTSLILDEAGSSVIAVDTNQLLRADLEARKGTAALSTFTLPIIPRALAVSADGTTLAATDQLNTIVVLRLPNLIDQCRITDTQYKTRVLAVSQQGGVIASVSSGPKWMIRLWDARTCELYDTLEQGGPEWTGVAFGERDKSLIGWTPGKLTIWARGEQTPRQTIEGTGWAVSALGTRAVSSTPESAQVYDLSSGRKVADIQSAPGGMYRVGLSPDGSTLWSEARVDRRIRGWDTRTAQIVRDIRW